MSVSRFDRQRDILVTLLRLSEELGYPDLETMLVAVFDRVLDPDAVVTQLIDLVDHRQ